MDDRRQHTSDAWIWTGIGAIAGFAFLAILSIGLFFLPLLAALIVFAFRRTAGHGSYGVLVGFGLLIVGITLPQSDFIGLAVFGACVAALGIVSCLVSGHRTSSS